MKIKRKMLKQLIETFLILEAKVKKYKVLSKLANKDEYSPPNSDRQVEVRPNSSINNCSKWARWAIDGTIGFDAWCGYSNKRVKVVSKVSWPGAQSWVTAADLFTKINKDYDNYKAYNDECKDLLQSIYDNTGKSNSSFKDYQPGTAVGIYYTVSGYHAHAFFGAATGRAKMGKGGQTSSGPFFRVKEDTKEYKENTLWKPEMIGKDIKFKPNVPLIKSTGGFCFNTHMGVIGATDMSTGEAIIYHNIGGIVYAVPVSKADNHNCKIIWAGVWPKKSIKTVIVNS